jgi:hypothetical protein
MKEEAAESSIAMATEPLLLSSFFFLLLLSSSSSSSSSSVGSYKETVTVYVMHACIHAHMHALNSIPWFKNMYPECIYYSICLLQFV